MIVSTTNNIREAIKSLTLSFTFIKRKEKKKLIDNLSNSMFVLEPKNLLD